LHGVTESRGVGKTEVPVLPLTGPLRAERPQAVDTFDEVDYLLLVGKIDGTHFEIELTESGVCLAAAPPAHAPRHNPLAIGRGVLHAFGEIDERKPERLLRPGSYTK
jgi:hypothetical protein